MSSPQADRASNPTLGQCLSGRQNNLNAIRMFAATCVLVSHAFPIALGEGTPEPLQALTGETLGGHAVIIFFILSGLLIAHSYDRGQNLKRFALARAARLYPALIVVTVLTVLAGAFFTTLPLAQYLAAPATLAYVPRNLSLAFLQYPLPGVFEANPLPRSINGSLWTLFYEVVCYGMVVVVGMAGLLRRRLAFTVAFAGLTLAYLASQPWQPDAGAAVRLKLLLVLGFPFALGMLAYVWRDHVALDPRIAAALWVLPFLGHGTVLQSFTIIVPLGYTIACLGFLPRGRVLAYNRLGDYSYGTYLYAFPVQQAAAYLFPGTGPLGNILMALPVTLILAALSWHLIEERALASIRSGNGSSVAPQLPQTADHP